MRRQPRRYREFRQIWKRDAAAATLAAMEQARLLHDAMCQLGVQRAVVVSHSWGTLVALALAVRYFLA